MFDYKEWGSEREEESIDNKEASDIFSGDALRSDLPEAILDLLFAGKGHVEIRGDWGLRHGRPG